MEVEGGPGSNSGGEKWRQAAEVGEKKMEWTGTDPRMEWAECLLL